MTIDFYHLYNHICMSIMMLLTGCSKRARGNIYQYKSKHIFVKIMMKTSAIFLMLQLHFSFLLDYVFRLDWENRDQHNLCLLNRYTLSQLLKLLLFNTPIRYTLLEALLFNPQPIWQNQVFAEVKQRNTFLCMQTHKR